MKIIKLTSVLLFLCFTTLLFGQNTIDLRPYIEVNGTAELKIEPNQIFISITLEENLDRDKKSIEEQENDLVVALKKAGLNTDKLRVSDASAYYGKRKRISKEVINRKTFELEVKDALESSNAFEAMDKLNIKNAFISRVSHTEMDAYKKEAKVKAIMAAREKANYLLEAVGETLGMPIIIRENAANSYQFNNRLAYANVAYDAIELGNARQDVADFKKITLNASVYTKWLIVEE